MIEYVYFYFNTIIKIKIVEYFYLKYVNVMIYFNNKTILYNI
jgi:hypothetical protein